MGCFPSKQKSVYIRVVDLYGYVQDFDCPVKVRQLIGRANKNQFVSTADKLLSWSGSKQLNPDTQLQPGNLYFLLPFYTLEDAASPLDYASIIKKLSSIAKSTRFVPSNISSPPNHCGDRPWKPILDTIKETSFTSRSDSELSRETIAGEVFF